MSKNSLWIVLHFSETDLNTCQTSPKNEYKTVLYSMSLTKYEVNMMEVNGLACGLHYEVVYLAMFYKKKQHKNSLGNSLS